jgi:hypothetical protein
MRRALSITQVLLSLIAVFILVVSCEKLPSTSSNSEYPADISGHVIIPEVLYVRNVTMWKNEGERENFWVVEISISNTSYEHNITHDCENWQIEAGGKVYPLGEGLMRALRYKEVPYHEEWDIPTGQSGKMTVCFSVPDTLKISDAIICYQGQEPYSYGKLTGGDLVEAYDWDSRVVTQLRNRGTE